MSTVAIPLLTVENYKILPETGPRYHLIEGDLYTAPAPNRYHRDISRNLKYILLEYLEKHPIGKLYDAPFDVYLDHYNVFQPGILVILIPFSPKPALRAHPISSSRFFRRRPHASTATRSGASMLPAESASFGSSRRRRGRSKSICSRRMLGIRSQSTERTKFLSLRSFRGCVLARRGSLPNSF